jgi:multiple sugar transport system substrate-binding protein
MKSKIFLINVVCILLLVVVFASNIIAAEQPFKGTKLIILSAGDGQEGVEITAPCIKGFEEKTGINVEFTVLSQSDLKTKLAVIFTTGSPDVDLLWVSDPWIPEFANAGFLEDITNKLSTEEWDQFVPGVLSCVTFKGKHYGMPRFFSIKSFYYNKKLFREAGLDPNKPPTTWDEFISDAKKLTDPAKGTWGVLTELGSNSCMMIYIQEYLVLTGGTIVDENDNITFNNEKGVKALEKMVEVVHELGVLDPAAFGISEGPAMRARWIQGYDGMLMGWAGDYNYSNIAPSKIIGECGVALIPSISTSGAVTGSEGYVISKFSNNKEAALEFLKYQASPEVQKAMFLRSGWYPVIKTVMQDPELASKSPLIKIAGAQSEYPTYRFAAPYATELDDILGPEILAAIRGEKTAQEALNDAAEAFKPIIEAFKK